MQNFRAQLVQGKKNRRLLTQPAVVIRSAVRYGRDMRKNTLVLVLSYGTVTEVPEDEPGITNQLLVDKRPTELDCKDQPK